MTYADYARALSAAAASSPLAEWRVVLKFYAVVHATNSRLYAEGRAPLTHTQHEQTLMGDATLHTFLPEYLELKQLSLDARYRPQSHPMTQAQLERADRLAQVLLTACGI